MPLFRKNYFNGPLIRLNNKLSRDFTFFRTGDLVADIIYRDPSVLDEVCLKLDYPVGKVPCTGKYWPHLAHNLGAKEQTRLRFQQKSGYTPSVRMFAYLSATSPDFSVDKLKSNLRSIERDDLVSMLEESSVKGKNITSIDRGKVQY